MDYIAVVNTLPWRPPEPIGSFKAAHYPGEDVIEPHLTIVYPVPIAVGERAFREHVRRVVSEAPPFRVRLRGIGKTWEHWLFLGVAEGRAEIVALHDALYTGILRAHLWTDRPYVPHVGLGFFAAQEDRHDLLALRPRALDRPRYERALREAEALELDYSGSFDSVHVMGLGGELTTVTPIEEVALGGRTGSGDSGSG
jgi:2'-5' RNA ligase